MSRLRHLTGIGLVVLGLLLLYRALSDAVPLVFWGTEEEHASREAGRGLLLMAALALSGSGALLTFARRPVAGALTAAAGLGAELLVLGFPDAAFAWLPFLVLGPIALVAAAAGR
jgi:hypothetical protein